MEGSKKKSSKALSRRGRPKKGKDLILSDASEEMIAQEAAEVVSKELKDVSADEVIAEGSVAPEITAEAEAAPVVMETPSIKAEAPVVSEEASTAAEAGAAGAEEKKVEAARVSVVVETVDDSETIASEAEPEQESQVLTAEAGNKESEEVSAMNEETKVEVKVDAPVEAKAEAPAPAPASAKKSVIANPDRQLVDMVKSRSFAGPKDKLPTYLL